MSSIEEGYLSSGYESEDVLSPLELRGRRRSNLGTSGSPVSASSTRLSGSKRAFFELDVSEDENDSNDGLLPQREKAPSVAHHFSAFELRQPETSGIQCENTAKRHKQESTCDSPTMAMQFENRASVALASAETTAAASSSASGTAWTKEDDSALISAIEIVGSTRPESRALFWSDVAKKIGKQRSAASCAVRFCRLRGKNKLPRLPTKAVHIAEAHSLNAYRSSAVSDNIAELEDSTRSSHALDFDQHDLLLQDAVDAFVAFASEEPMNILGDEEEHPATTSSPHNESRHSTRKAAEAATKRLREARLTMQRMEAVESGRKKSREEMKRVPFTPEEDELLRKAFDSVMAQRDSTTAKSFWIKVSALMGTGRDHQCCQARYSKVYNGGVHLSLDFGSTVASDLVEDGVDFGDDGASASGATGGRGRKRKEWTEQESSRLRNTVTQLLATWQGGTKGSFWSNVLASFPGRTVSDVMTHYATRWNKGKQPEISPPKEFKSRPWFEEDLQALQNSVNARVAVWDGQNSLSFFWQGVAEDVSKAMGHVRSGPTCQQAYARYFNRGRQLRLPSIPTPPFTKKSVPRQQQQATVQMDAVADTQTFNSSPVEKRAISLPKNSFTRSSDETMFALPTPRQQATYDAHTVRLQSWVQQSPPQQPMQVILVPGQANYGQMSAQAPQQHPMYGQAPSQYSGYNVMGYPGAAAPAARSHPYQAWSQQPMPVLAIRFRIFTRNENMDLVTPILQRVDCNVSFEGLLLRVQELLMAMHIDSLLIPSVEYFAYTGQLSSCFDEYGWSYLREELRKASNGNIIDLVFRIERNLTVG